jgi:hypothetical protein
LLFELVFWLNVSHGAKIIVNISGTDLVQQITDLGPATFFACLGIPPQFVIELNISMELEPLSRIPSR